jgi:hypothetical protein
LNSNSSKNTQYRRRVVFIGLLLATQAPLPPNGGGSFSRLPIRLAPLSGLDRCTFALVLLTAGTGIAPD